MEKVGEEQTLEFNGFQPGKKELLNITFEERREAQKDDHYCKQQANFVGILGCLFDFAQFGLLCRKAPLDEAIRKVFSKVFMAIFL